MNTELRKAIRTKLLTTTPVVFFDQAPKNQDRPYIVYRKMDGENDYDSNEKFPKDLVQVTGYGDDLDDLEVIEAAVEAILDQQQSTFSLTDYYLVEVIKRFDTQTKVEDVYLFIHQYFFDREHK